MTRTPTGGYGASLTIFRTLLALYPKDFRARFAAQMAAVAVGAVIIPARRAARVDPIIALRYD